jgi:hypothetical protein
VTLYFYSTKLKAGSKYLYLTWSAFEHQVKKIFTNTLIQGKKQSNTKKQRKIGALRCRPAKPHGQLTMSCCLPALVKFLSGPHNSTKYVVMLGLAVIVG